MIDKYIQALINKIDDFPLIISSDLHYYIDSPQKGYLRGSATFIDNSNLTMIEVLNKNINTIDPVKYRYHYMDEKQELIFRYDNAPHYKHLSSFPHHKHILVKNEEKVITTDRPTLNIILDEISDYIFNNFSTL